MFSKLKLSHAFSSNFPPFLYSILRRTTNLISIRHSPYSIRHPSCNLHTYTCPSVLGNSIPKRAQLGPRDRLSTSVHQVKTRRSASQTNSNATETIPSCSSSYAAPLHTCRFSPHSCSSLLHYGSVSLLFRLSSRLLHSLFSHSLSMKNKYFQPNWP